MPRTRIDQPNEEQCAYEFIMYILAGINEERLQYGACLFAGNEQLPVLPEPGVEEYSAKLDEYNQVISALLDRDGFETGVSRMVTRYRTCVNCNNAKDPKTDPETIISLTLEEHRDRSQSVQQLLTQYTGRNEIDWPCDEYGCCSDFHYETTDFGSHSQYLIVNIKLHQQIYQQLTRKKKHAIQVENRIHVFQCFYEIVAIICHIGDGGIAQGHYWAYLMEDGRFVRYNDSIRQVTDIAEFKSMHNHEEQPYIMLYKKMSPAGTVPMSTGRYVCFKRVIYMLCGWNRHKYCYKVISPSQKPMGLCAGIHSHIMLWK